jgi:hypothetical protein
MIAAMELMIGCKIIETKVMGVGTYFPEGSEKELRETYVQFGLEGPGAFDGYENLKADALRDGVTADGVSWTVEEFLESWGEITEHRGSKLISEAKGYTAVWTLRENES